MAYGDLESYRISWKGTTDSAHGANIVEALEEVSTHEDSDYTMTDGAYVLSTLDGELPAEVKQTLRTLRIVFPRVEFKVAVQKWVELED